MIKLVDLLKEVVEKVKCKNCGWSWNLSDGGKDTYVCHKCKYDNKNNKFVKAIKEMADTDDDFSMIMYIYKNGSNEQKSIISSALALGPISNENKVSKALTEADKDDIEYIKEQLGIDDLKVDVNNPEELKQLNRRLGIGKLSEACWDGYEKDPNNPMKKKGDKMVPNCIKVREEKKGSKLNPAYLTKDASQMKKDIEKRKSLKSDDPAAYTKWDADYSDKAMTKKYKTRKSTSTTAYEKRFGKKEKVNEEKPHEKEMIDGIVDMLKQVKDIQNRKKMALDRLKDFKKEDITVDVKEFLKRCGLKFTDNQK